MKLLYGSTVPDRAVLVALALAERFPNAGAPALYSAPVRTELGGNHTDHHLGHGLCASVDLDTLACAAPRETLINSPAGGLFTPQLCLKRCRL